MSECGRETGLICGVAGYGGKILGMRTLKTLRLDGFLSFAPGSEPIELEPLNVLIGPNGGGKSNLIEAIELLRATPTNVAECIRDGGGVREWLWKGEEVVPASIEAVVEEGTPTRRPLRYRLEFSEATSRLEVLDEAIEEVEPQPDEPDVYFYYRFQRGRPVVNVAAHDQGRYRRHLERESLLPDQSVLAQRKDPDQYPEVTWLGERFGSFSTFREWTIGRYAPLRTPQPGDLPEDSFARGQPQPCARPESDRAPRRQGVRWTVAAFPAAVRADVDTGFGRTGTVLSTRAGPRISRAGYPFVGRHDQIRGHSRGTFVAEPAAAAVHRGT